MSKHDFVFIVSMYVASLATCVGVFAMIAGNHSLLSAAMVALATTSAVLMVATMLKPFKGSVL